MTINESIKIEQPNYKSTEELREKYGNEFYGQFNDYLIDGLKTLSCIYPTKKDKFLKRIQNYSEVKLDDGVNREEALLNEIQIALKGGEFTPIDTDTQWLKWFHYSEYLKKFRKGELGSKEVFYVKDSLTKKRKISAALVRDIN